MQTRVYEMDAKAEAAAVGAKTPEGSPRDLPEVVFIIARHVKSASTKPLWEHSYASIRRVHPDAPILIIDDRSTYPPGDTAGGAPLTNCTVVASEHPQRGELLPYYYFHKLRPARKAVVVHDSVFVNRPLDVAGVTTHRFLWHFTTHQWDEDRHVLPVLAKCKNGARLCALYKDKKSWLGCFGAMSIVTWDFLHRIDETYNFFDTLLPAIVGRPSRMWFERIYAVACVSLDAQRASVSGDVFAWIEKEGLRWGQSYAAYLRSPRRLQYDALPLMKVWAGR
uniref:Uncharacterized protein n=1 Tax=Marseillevirus LCMAC103 TaxID=2506604 RepID=A0A481YVP2_9VIRU|nr:MAG: hypothetical protein LCMAC103_03130 [Marseillevirus LCMAC103]